jgi:hypothetical protein
MLEPSGVIFETEFRLFGGLTGMGKTVPTYRMAIEDEIAQWKTFRNSLPSDEEKQAFDEIIDMCRIQAMAGSNACKPILFEPMVMSILLGQQKRIRQLEKDLKEAKQPENQR